MDPFTKTVAVICAVSLALVLCTMAAVMCFFRFCCESNQGGGFLSPPQLGQMIFPRENRSPVIPLGTAIRSSATKKHSTTILTMRQVKTLEDFNYLDEEHGTYDASSQQQHHCAICMDGDDKASRLPARPAFVLPCLHRFHRDCIMEWLTTQKPLCPLCNDDVRKRIEEIHSENTETPLFGEDSDQQGQ